MNAAQALTQWLGGAKTGQDALAEAERKLEAHVANPPNSADSSEHRAWLGMRRQLEDDVDAEKRALIIAQEKVAEARAAAEEEAIDAEAKEAERAAREAAKLAVEIDHDARRVAAKVSRLCELNAAVEAYNHKRGARPRIVDGEHRVRALPDRTEAAVYEEHDVWSDGAGRTPSVFRQLPSGELVPNEGGFIKTRERVLVSAERVIHGGIPGARFGEGIKLIGLKGEALFPTR
jgi:hypothetical protein